jgi:hypothetical protein
MSNKNYVSYNVANLAKEKGFDNIECDAYFHINEGYTEGYVFCYTNNIFIQTKTALLCPTIWNFKNWIKEKHNIFVVIEPSIEQKYYYSLYNLKDKRCSELSKDIDDLYFDTEEDAYNAAFEYILTKLINNVDKNN